MKKKNTDGLQQELMDSPDKAVPFHKASAVPGFRQPSLQAHNTGTEDDSAMDYGGLRKSDGDIFRSYRPVWQALP